MTGPETPLRVHPPAGDLVDDSGQLTLTIDEQGRISNLVLGARWREHLSPQQLAAAITTVPLAAQMTALTEALKEINDQREEPSPEPAPAAVPVPASAVRRAAEELTDMSTYVWADIQALLASPSPVPVRQVADSQHHVTVTVRGGEVDGLTLDEGWASRAARNDLVEDILEALTAAYAVIDEDETPRFPPKLQGHLDRLSRIRVALGGMP